MRIISLILSIFLIQESFAASCKNPVKSDQVLSLVEYAINDVFGESADYSHPTVCFYSEEYHTTMIDAQTEVTFLDNGRLATDLCMVEVYTVDRKEYFWTWSMKRISCNSGRKSSYLFDRYDLEAITGSIRDGEYDDYYDEY